jgi:hypothetical protein
MSQLGGFFIKKSCEVDLLAIIHNLAKFGYTSEISQIF